VLIAADQERDRRQTCLPTGSSAAAAGGTPGMGVNLSACACPNADRWVESPLYMNPVLSFYDGSESASRRQAPSPSYGVSRGRNREVVSEESRSAKL
jgi:hypothetical protein